MTILATKVCVTCTKPCYPTERLMVSDLWVHKAGCLKCSECSTTLSLSSVYVAPSPASPHERLLWCAKDVPKMVHTSVVDSIALKTAMNAPNPTSTPAAVFAKSKSQGKTLRFKGLTIRSKAISSSMNAPKLDITGKNRTQQVFVGHVGTGLDSWDIAHAMAVQTQVSSPIRAHPAVHAQRTGSAGGQWPMPSQPSTPALLEPDMTGASIASAKTNEEGVNIEPDLVKNLIKVFQLDTLDAVEIVGSPGDMLHQRNYFDEPENAHEDLVSDTDSIEGEAEHEGEGQKGRDADKAGRSTWKGTYKPSYSTLSAITAMSTCGTYRASGMEDFSTCTIKTLGTIGSKRGTLTLARIKGTLRRPRLTELFTAPKVDMGEETDGDDKDEDEHKLKEEHDTLSGEIVELAQPKFDMLRLTKLAAGTPANTPMKGLGHARDATGGGDDLASFGSLRGTIKGNGTLRGTFRGKSGTVRGTKLLEALLPVAAHLVPLPIDDNDDVDYFDEHGDAEEREFGGGCENGTIRSMTDSADASDWQDGDNDDDAQAQLELIKHLEMGGLELIMLFEEEPERLAILV